MEQTAEQESSVFDLESNEFRVSVRNQLETDGYVYLRQGIGREIAESVANDVWAYLEPVGVFRDRTTSWPIGRPQRGPVFRAIRDYEEGLLPLFTDNFEQTMGELIDPSLRVGQEQILYMTFPNSDHDHKRWRVPWASWHNDFTGDGTGSTRAYLGFVLLNDVEPGGGNLVLLTGSHRLEEVIAPQHASAIMKQLSRKSTVLERLWDRKEDAQGALVGERCTVDGVELRILEMTGNAGDLFLLNGSLLHAPTANERPDARIAAKCFLYFRK